MIELGVGGGARAAFAGWRVGLLELEGLLPREVGAALSSEASRIEGELGGKFGGMGRKEIALVEPARSYAEFFSRSGKAYPVVLQAEAIASKGRKLSMPDPLVQAMFAAELESLLLTAGHDLDALRPPLALSLAEGTEAMPTLGGVEKRPPRGDLIMRDAEGIIASVLLGPDARTSIGPATEGLLFVVYSPPEVPKAELLAHLDRLASLSALACPRLRAGAARVLEL